MSDSLPQPQDIPAREKEDAMGAYLMVFGALHLGLPIPFLGLIAAAIYHAINGKKSPFVGFHSYQSMLFSIPASLVSAVWVIWAVAAFIQAMQSSFQAPPGFNAFWVFTVFSVLVYLVYVVYCIVGAVQSRKGKFIYFPVFGRLAYHRYFVANHRPQPTESRNEPPRGL